MVGEVMAALLVGVAALWLVLHPLLRPGSAQPEAYEPLDLEETPKGIALAALKEIEFDRETGKLSDADYELLKTRYTAAALTALRDEKGPVSDDIEALISARVRSLRSASATTSPDTPATIPSTALGPFPACNACGPCAEPDALYCSACGGPVAA